MASVNPEAGEVLEPASKRRKLSPSISEATIPINDNTAVKTTLIDNGRSSEVMRPSQSKREAEVGILCFVNESNPGFTGILKQRYTDYIVNEVTLDGQVVHLTNINLPRRKDVEKQSNLATVHSAQAERDLIPPKTTSPELKTSSTAPAEVSIQNDEKLAADQKDLTGTDQASAALSPDDVDLLDSFFGPAVRELVVKLYEKVLQQPNAKPASLGTVTSDPINDRQLRTKIHGEMRRISHSKLETASDADGAMTFIAAQTKLSQGRYGRNQNNQDNSWKQQPKGKVGWQELGGEHLHFSLYKENKDTMEVISYISAQLRIKPKEFAFAGTKDRRAVTVQRVSVFRVRAEQLVKLNSSLRNNSKVGDFKYEKNRLELGDLLGNEFLITLRDCHFNGDESLNEEDRITFATKVVSEAVENMRDHGFINYFGLQRFGTYATGTDVIGLKILQGDFEGAVNGILAYNEDALASALDPDFTPADGQSLPRDDIARAKAINHYKTTGKANEAALQMPRKFNAEISIIRHLGRQGRDFSGALLQIQRNLRLMYVHAYQSLIWNMVATKRWAQFGDKVIKGDLVFVDSAAEKHSAAAKENEVDENGEIIVRPAADDTAVSSDDVFQRARPLTAEEAASGKYTIFDIVLPTPGYDIEYPDNEIGDYYKEFMGSERGGGIDPGNMRRSQKDFSLSGSYRKLMATVGSDMSYEVKLYTDENEQMVQTDLEKILKSKQNSGGQTSGNRARGALNGHANGKGLDHGLTPEQLKAADGWKNLPSKLAEEDKAAAELHDAQRAAEKESPKSDVVQPTFKDTFIETSADQGQRTGHRDTTIMPSMNKAASIKSDSDSIMSEASAMIKEAEADYVVVPKKLFSINASTASDKDSAMSEVLSIKEQEDADTEALNPYAKTTTDIAPTDMAPPPIPERSPKRKQVQKEEFPAALIAGTDGTSVLNPPAKVFEQGEQRKKIAVVVKFQLGSSQYATMALRELMKQGGVQTYQAQFTGAPR